MPWGDGAAAAWEPGEDSAERTGVNLVGWPEPDGAGFAAISSAAGFRTWSAAGDAASAVLAPGFAAADGVSLVSSAVGEVLGALSAFAAFVASPSAAGGGSGTAFSEPLGRLRYLWVL